LLIVSFPFSRCSGVLRCVHPAAYVPYLPINICAQFTTLSLQFGSGEDRVFLQCQLQTLDSERARRLGEHLQLLSQTNHVFPTHMQQSTCQHHPQALYRPIMDCLIVVSPHWLAAALSLPRPKPQAGRLGASVLKAMRRFCGQLDVCI
jgi:hypothetical protein